MGQDNKHLLPMMYNTETLQGMIERIQEDTDEEWRIKSLFIYHDEKRDLWRGTMIWDGTIDGHE